MAEACRALDFPVVSGNVSLYNETKNEDGSSLAILPTPAIGGVGLLKDWEKSASIGLKKGAEDLWLIGGKWPDPSGPPLGHLGQSLWLREIAGRCEGKPPRVDLDLERRAGEFIRELLAAGLVSAVHDVSDGGLLVAVAEMALANGIGIRLDLPDLDRRALAAWCFGEDQGRYLIAKERTPGFDLIGAAGKAGVPAWPIGLTSESDGVRLVKGGDLANAPDIPVADLRAAHESFFPKLMGSELTPEF
jgi:phosphoribosylformylglycinamidine synthase